MVPEKERTKQRKKIKQNETNAVGSEAWMTTTCFTRSYIPYISTHDARPGTQDLVVSRADKIVISA